MTNPGNSVQIAAKNRFIVQFNFQLPFYSEQPQFQYKLEGFEYRLVSMVDDQFQRIWKFVPGKLCLSGQE